MKKNLRDLVDIEDVAEAIGMGSIDSAYYLDIETSEIIWLPDQDLVELDEDRERIESDSTNRYLCIP